MLNFIWTLWTACCAACAFTVKSDESNEPPDCRTESFGACSKGTLSQSIVRTAFAAGALPDCVSESLRVAKCFASYKLPPDAAWPKVVGIRLCEVSHGVWRFKMCAIRSVQHAFWIFDVFLHTVRWTGSEIWWKTNKLEEWLVGKKCEPPVRFSGSNWPYLESRFWILSLPTVLGNG